MRKNSPGERERYLATVPMPTELRQLGVASEDAFDAAVSAVVMAVRVEELRALPDGSGYALEGMIWQPRQPIAIGAGGDRLPTDAYGEFRTAIAVVIQEAAAHGESATAQADRVLDMLRRRGILGRGSSRPAG